MEYFVCFGAAEFQTLILRFIIPWSLDRGKTQLRRAFVISAGRKRRIERSRAGKTAMRLRGARNIAPAEGDDTTHDERGRYQYWSYWSGRDIDRAEAGCRIIKRPLPSTRAWRSANVGEVAAERLMGQGPRLHNDEHRSLRLEELAGFPAEAGRGDSGEYHTRLRNRETRHDEEPGEDGLQLSYGGQATPCISETDCLGRGRDHAAAELDLARENLSLEFQCHRPLRPE